MNDEIGIHDDMDKPIRTHLAVTAARVEYYDDVVEHMTQCAVDRYIKQHNRKPSDKKILAARSEIARLAIISRDLVNAHKVDIT
jgi:hypothetical protein